MSPGSRLFLLVLGVWMFEMTIGYKNIDSVITLRRVWDGTELPADSFDYLSETLNDSVKLDKLYSKYQSIYGKVEAEENKSKRKSIFKANLIKMSKHNADFKSGKVKYNMGVNQFTDMTYSEVIGKYTGYRQSSNITNVTLKDQSRPKRQNSVPESIDWRNYGLVTSVKNQGQCGSCVLFSCTACLESYYALTHGQWSGQLDLSEEELLCCDNGSEYPGNGGCDGNGFPSTFKYLKNIGLSLEKDYPYNAQQGKCLAAEKKHAAKLNTYWSVAPNDENALKQAVGRFGPVSVAFHVSDSFMRFGGSGIYTGPCDGPRNHAVLVVGYGNQNGQDYWILKNQWGTSWGDQGYIKIGRNMNNLCGIVGDAVGCSDVAIAVA